MIIGHQKQLESLEKMRQAGKIPHAMLFCGQEHLGKKTVAIEFLKSFFGENVFFHPDFVLVEPQENEIQISQIRDLNWKLSLKPLAGQIKAVLIDRAHLMNQEAQNCFLKTLEEPSTDTMIILASECPEHLLPTIRSRVQKIKFFPVAKIEIENYLKTKKMPAEKIAALAGVVMGRPGLAVNFAENPESLADFKEKIKELAVILDSDLATRFNYAKKIAEEENSNEILKIWLGFFRNTLLAKLNLEKKWVVLRQDYALDRLAIILKNIQSTIFLLSKTNINQRLAFELLLTEM
jgi:DNA polymerase III subunit delta'